MPTNANSSLLERERERAPLFQAESKESWLLSSLFVAKSHQKSLVRPKQSSNDAALIHFRFNLSPQFSGEGSILTPSTLRSSSSYFSRPRLIFPRQIRRPVQEINRRFNSFVSRPISIFVPRCFPHRIESFIYPPGTEPPFSRRDPCPASRLFSFSLREEIASGAQRHSRHSNEKETFRGRNLGNARTLRVKGKVSLVYDPTSKLDYYPKIFLATAPSVLFLPRNAYTAFILLTISSLAPYEEKCFKIFFHSVPSNTRSIERGGNEVRLSPAFIIRLLPLCPRQLDAEIADVIPVPLSQRAKRREF